MTDFERQKRRRARLWAAGYSRAELDAAQQRYGLEFPPDLIDLFLDRRPAQGYDWRNDHDQIRAMLAWPLEGLLFDVEQNALWLPEWGERPSRSEARAEVVAATVKAAPALIPLVSHRYLPAEPRRAGNPVFSVYQSDIIHYGSDLENYFQREFVDLSTPLKTPIRRVRFWTHLVELNGG